MLTITHTAADVAGRADGRFRLGTGTLGDGSMLFTHTPLFPNSNSVHPYIRSGGEWQGCLQGKAATVSCFMQGLVPEFMQTHAVRLIKSAPSVTWRVKSVGSFFVLLFFNICRTQVYSQESNLGAYVRQRSPTSPQGLRLWKPAALPHERLQTTAAALPRHGQRSKIQPREELRCWGNKRTKDC